jgi:GMP synthase-like glutamine amidotransferase
VYRYKSLSIGDLNLEGIMSMDDENVALVVLGICFGATLLAFFLIWCCKAIHRESGSTSRATEISDTDGDGESVAHTIMLEESEPPITTTNSSDSTIVIPQ